MRYAGTMWAYLATSGGDSASASVTLLPPEIKLVCNPPSVVRTNNVQCTASANGTLITSSWTFVSGDQQQTVVRTSGIDNPTWSGPMVVGGTVTVTGTVDSVSAVPGTSTVTVTPRMNWSWRADTSSRFAAESDTTWDCYKDPIDSASTLGWTMGPSCSHVAQVFTPDPSIGDGDFPSSGVTDGPNTGLWYVNHMSTGLHSTAQILKDLRANGTKYTVSAGDPVAPDCRSIGLLGPPPASAKLSVAEVNIDCKAYLGAFKFDSLLTFLRGHEMCHMQRRSYQFQLVPDIRLDAESMIRHDSLNLSIAVRLRVDSANDAIKEFSKQIDQPSTDIFTYWSYRYLTGTWSIAEFPPKAILPVDAICH
jgi:hypothetical protein